MIPCVMVYYQGGHGITAIYGSCKKAVAAAFPANSYDKGNIKKKQA